jgi:purine-nucleoside phosphorylase
MTPDANRATGMKYPMDLRPAVDALRRRLPDTPEVAVVLGSGLSHLADLVEDAVEVPFDEVPGFPDAGVAGHAGRYVFGSLGGRKVLIQAGRFHLYEGHGDEVVGAPVRVAAALGVGFLVLTNAAGGVDPELDPGDLMLVHDHLNLMFRSPLIGEVRAGEERFPDMSAPYDRELCALAQEVAVDLGIPLRRGVYAALTGPSYETAAEVRMLGVLGADAVGMSTVPEVLVARAVGLRCLAFSMITNKGTGLSPTALSHAEVVDVGARAGQALGRLVAGVIGRLSSLPHSTGAK